MIVNRAYLYFAFKIKDAVFIGDFNAPHPFLQTLIVWLGALFYLECKQNLLVNYIKEMTQFFNKKEKDFLITNKITTIINCASGQLRPISHPFPLKILEFNWKDSDDQVILDEKDDNINKVYNAIYETVDKGESVLVCSMRGQSRSLTLISAFFMKRYKWTLYKTLEFMNSKRSDFEIRANFLKQLVSFEKRLFGDDLSQCSRTWKDDTNPEPEAEMMKNTFLNSQKLPIFQENQKPRSLSNSLHKSSVVIQKISWSIELAQEMKEEQPSKVDSKISSTPSTTSTTNTPLYKKSILKVKVDRNSQLPSIEEISIEEKESKEKDPNLTQLEQYKNEFLTNSLLKSESKTYEQIYKRNMLNLSRESPIHFRKKTDNLSLPNSQVVDCKQKNNQYDQIQQQNNQNASPILDSNRNITDTLNLKIQDTNQNNRSFDQQMRDSKYPIKEQGIYNPQNPATFQIKSNVMTPNLSRNPTPQQQKQNKQYRKSPIPLPFHSRRFMYRNTDNSNTGESVHLNQNTTPNQNFLPPHPEDYFKEQNNLNMTQNIQLNSQTQGRYQNNSLLPSQNMQNNILNNSARIPIKKLSTDISENNENDQNKFEIIKINPNQISLPPTTSSRGAQSIVTPPVYSSSNGLSTNTSNLTNNNQSSNLQVLNLTEFNSSGLHQPQNTSNNQSFRNNNMNATKVVNFRKYSISNNNSPDHKSSTQNGFKNNLQNHSVLKPHQFTTPKNPQDQSILTSKKKNTFTFYDNGNSNQNTNTQNSSAIKSPYANFLPSLKDKNQKFSLPKRGIYHPLNQEISVTEGNSPVNNTSNNLVFTEVTIDGYLNQDFTLNGPNNSDTDQFKLNLQKARNTMTSKDTPLIQTNHPRDQRSLSMAEQRRTQTESSADTYQHQKKKMIIQSNNNNTTWLTPKETTDQLQKLQNPIKSISIKSYEKKTPKYFKNVLKKDNLFQQQLATNITFS